MASYCKKIAGLELQSYDDMVTLYKLVTIVSMKIDLENPRITEQFLFDLGEITCVCESYDELVENAYGAESFRFVSAQIMIWNKRTPVISVSCIGKSSVTVSADSRTVLEKFFIEYETAKNHSQNPTNGIVQNINNSVVVTGSGNIAANNSGKIEIKTEQKETTTKRFWSGILQNIASNLLWYILTLAAGALFTYLAMR